MADGKHVHTDVARTEALLVEQPTLFANHLVIARWLDGWRDEVQRDGALAGDRVDGLVEGLAQVAAHLRQGDLLPGGALHDGVLAEGAPPAGPTT